MKRILLRFLQIRQYKIGEIFYVQDSAGRGRQKHQGTYFQLFHQKEKGAFEVDMAQNGQIGLEKANALIKRSKGLVRSKVSADTR